MSSLVVRVELNLLPLANALDAISAEMRSTAIRRGVQRGVEKFRSAAHKALKDETKIQRPNRLKIGVSRPVVRAVGDGFEGEYRIRDRNIRITRGNFRASYRPYGKPGAQARWGGSATPAGAKWTSWDGTRVGKRTFMMKTFQSVWLNMGKGRGNLRPVYGPNPAEMMRLRAPRFAKIMADEGGKEVARQAALAYKRAEASAKRKFGL